MSGLPPDMATSQSRGAGATASGGPEEVGRKGHHLRAGERHEVDLDRVREVVHRRPGVEGGHEGDPVEDGGGAQRGPR